MEAALKGAKEVAFTIVSMTLSLVAVFIPVLFMGGIVGRLLHEFAVTISVAILVSGFVSISLTPMLCARWLRPGTHLRHGRAYMAIERRVRVEPPRPTAGRCARRCSYRGGDARRSRCCCSARPSTCSVVIPKGFIPTRRHRQHQRDDGVRAGHRLRRDGRAPEAGRRHHQGRSERAAVHVERRQRAGRRRGHRPGPLQHRPEAACPSGSSRPTK